MSINKNEDKNIKLEISKKDLRVINKRGFNFRKIILPTALCVTIAGGSVYMVSLAKELKEARDLARRNEYIAEQAINAQKTASRTETFINTLEAKLNSVDQYYPIWEGTITVDHDKEYLEDVSSFEMFGKEIKYVNESIHIFGRADAFFQYGLNLGDKVVEKVNDNTIEVRIPEPFFNEDVVHRVAGSYSPDPDHKNKISKHADRTIAIERGKGQTNTMMNRAMIAWEDSFDENVVTAIKAQHADSKELKELNDKAVDLVKELIESFNLTEDMNVKVVIDKELGKK